jgi:peptidoglycan hydrolase-like protein with peptidoglycan-binding domain
MKLRYSVIAAAMAAACTFGALAAGNQYVDSDTVRQVQQILNDRGFRTGVDGIMGPRTQAALKRFQSARDLDPTGQLNRQTLVALGIQKADSTASDEQNRYDRQTLRSAQRTLNNRGFQAGPANGNMTPQTRAALKEFQKSENLEETGQLNPGTLAALGIPPGDTLVLSNPVVRQMQQRLKSRGFDAGPADGRMGASTRAAIREFQRSENLPVSGRPDRETLSTLGISGPLAARQ